MTDPIFLTCPIEVIATSPRREMILTKLRAAGLRPYQARERLSQSDALFIDAPSATEAQLRQVHRQMTRATERTVVLLSDGTAPTMPNVIQIFNTAEIKGIPALLDMAARKRLLVKEVHLRARTAKQIAGSAIKTPDSDQLDLLFLGDGASEYLALVSELRREKINVTAALTPLTTHQYLQDRKFHGLVVDIRRKSKVGAEFLTTYMPSDIAALVPVFALRDKEGADLAHLGELSTAITELVDMDPDIGRVSQTLADLAYYHASLAPLTPEQASDFRIRDQFSPLFTARFLEQHLHNQLEEVGDTPTPLCLMTVQVTSKADENASARAAMPMLAATLQRALRQTDCAARLDWSTLGVSLTNTSYAGGVRLAQRLVALLEARHPEIMRECKLDWRVIERRAYHKVSDLINIGKTGPQTRIFNAA